MITMVIIFTNGTKMYQKESSLWAARLIGDIIITTSINVDKIYITDRETGEVYDVLS